MKIRLEESEDYIKVENMVRNAFWNIYRPGAFEHFIVHNLRNDESFVKDLAYVIEKDGEIIGHINYSIGSINFEDGSVEDGLVLGPIAVEENYQNQGYGTRLISCTLNLIEKQKTFPFVFVIGDENYYSRFGFEAASKYDLYLEGTDTSEENPFFMIRIFNHDKLSSKQGTFSNPEVFNVDERDVDEFDKQFEYKQKLVLEGQLDV